MSLKITLDKTGSLARLATLMVNIFDCGVITMVDDYNRGRWPVRKLGNRRRVYLSMIALSKEPSWLAFLQRKWPVLTLGCLFCVNYQVGSNVRLRPLWPQNWQVYYLTVVLVGTSIVPTPLTCKIVEQCLAQFLLNLESHLLCRLVMSGWLCLNNSKIYSFRSHHLWWWSFTSMASWHHS